MKQQLFTWMWMPMVFLLSIPQLSLGQTCTGCQGYSSLTCTEMVKPLPLHLRFDGNDGGLPDKNGAGMGFTMALEASGGPNAQDTAYDASACITGLKTSLLEVQPTGASTGKLIMSAGNGKNYQAANDHVNHLGVGLNVHDKRIYIETSIEDNPVTQNWAQMGLWYGLDEDNYAKLIISKFRVQLVVEKDTFSTQIRQAEISDYTTEGIRLILEVDNTNGQKKVRGYYQVKGRELVHVGDLNYGFARSTDFSGGPQDVSFVGIMSSRENRAEFDTKFEYFKVKEVFSNVLLEATSLVPESNWLVEMPYNLDFSGNRAGLGDTSAVGTGFTMVATAASYLASDDSITYAEVPGYEPKTLKIESGNLIIQTNEGKAYLDNNQQINMLGVGLQADSQVFYIETILPDPQTGGNNAHMGLWYGWDQDNYVKLTIVGDNLELSCEHTQDATPEVRRTTYTGISGHPLRLILLIDNPNQTFSAYYQSLDGTNSPVTFFYRITQPHYDFGPGLTLDNGTTGVSFAGVLASDENRASFQAKYDAFSIRSDFWASSGGNWNQVNWTFAEDDQTVSTTAGSQKPKPSTNSRLFIKGQQVTLNQSVTCQSLELIDTASAATKLTIPSGESLTVTAKVKLRKSASSGSTLNCNLEVADGGNLEVQP